jgi:hypothetical protein
MEETVTCYLSEQMGLTEWTKERALQLERKDKVKPWVEEECDGPHIVVYHLLFMSPLLFLLK